MAPMSDPNATPPVPPVEPAPPAPPVPPVPQYGEYAPAGYVPPQPVAGPAPVTDPAQPYGAASYPQQATGRKRKTWDIVLTTVLLVIGFFGAGAGVLYGVLFSDPVLIAETLDQAGYPGFNGEAGAAPIVLIVSHVVLYLIALSSIALLIARRVAFWVPLAAGVIAAIFFWSALTAVLLSDPAFVSQIS
jgi:hypothetical protein